LPAPSDHSSRQSGKDRQGPARTGKFLFAIYNPRQKQCDTTDNSQSSFQLLPID
jgi:hypothetical protein